MRSDAPADVVIMGAGAAGALFADRLTAAGQRVVVLEAGEGWALSDLVSSQIWARRLKWGGAPVLPGGAHPFGHNFAVGSGMGGSAIHHYASWPRLRAQDFRLGSTLGLGQDWPIDAATLAPWYDRVQAEMLISGDAAAEGRDGAPYPLPPVKVFAQARLLARGFAARGFAVCPNPMAVMTEDRDDRPECLYDGWCDAGCPTGTLANPLVVHWPRALAAGAVLRTRANVLAIATDAAGRATGLDYVDAAGERAHQPAARIVLAGAAVQNARLLLASRSTAHPLGFGNAHAQVGRWFNCHSIGNVHGLFTEQTEPHMGLAAGGLMSFADYGKQRESGPRGSITWGIAPAVKPNDLLGLAMTRADLFGPALHAFMAKAARHIGIINAICENLPVADNRIELATETDRFGVPLARIVHTLHPDSAALWEHALQDGETILRAAGATQVWSGRQRALGHVSGGTIMGRDPVTSVTNDIGQIHGAANVVVAGGGLFPSIGAVSPTFTVLALAARTAAAMIDERGRFAA
ncbi:hypothetical protein GCM10007973_05540 [Polymorphobacter multimanifer]|uniref:Choline dehydrogenase-like flavoprotein n=1 Tax=Polymorphobacter multimanifer TaxID=1070431 RepID=A0A841L732_9SPHN|nr:GMC family oxidoreductase [Polymorphobacter multimanifer]MBB6226763.1 choline dehydrogenase-like flavoprotein [Polymorphobacter multimanifer]GGI71459.1 hypothetical protein GCM10007973_05540 [Polymorphobacter multimanifer]